MKRAESSSGSRSDVGEAADEQTTLIAKDLKGNHDEAYHGSKHVGPGSTYGTSTGLPSRNLSAWSLDVTEGENAAEDEKASCCTWMARDCYQVGRVAVPLMFSLSLVNFCFVVIIYFMSHYLVREEFAGASMGMTLANLSAISLGIGLASALDTLCSQQYGRDPTSSALGVLVQRAFFLTFLLFIPLTIFGFHSEPLLLLVFPPEIAKHASIWLRWSVFSTFPTVLFECYQKFLQAQGEQDLMFSTSAVGAVVLPGLLYALRKHGLLGFIVAISIKSWLTFFLLFYLSMRKPNVRATWGRFYKRSMNLRPLGTYLCIALPSAAAYVADFWAFEAMSVMAGHLGALPTASWAIQMNLIQLFWGPPAGLCSAASVKVGNALGAGRPVQARRMAVASVVLALAAGSFCGWLVLTFGNPLIAILSDDHEVQQRGYIEIPYTALMIFIDVIFYVGQGIYRGAGKNGLAMLVVCGCLWGLGVPMSYYLGIEKHGMVPGIMSGFIMAAGATLPCLLAIEYFVFDWDVLAKEAQSRTHAHHEEQSEVGFH